MFGKKNKGKDKESHNDTDTSEVDNDGGLLDATSGDDFDELDEMKGDEKPAKLSETEDQLKEAEEQQAKAQKAHDALVEDSFGEEEQETVRLSGMDLDKISLTTIKYMRKAGSCIVEGKMPDTEADMLHEIGLYLLFHHSDTPIKERARISRLQGEELEDEVDAFMHDVNVANLQDTFAAISHKLAEETQTLAIPTKDKDGDEEGDDTGGNS